ncbi:phage head closure protein [Marinifilum flexuosum]|uniref:phage head closure protein n=1 Tax=Marinifilum flexuosum TaxID=1117708 RepID=UPI002495A30C|nr:phage head closure protein [Marinifilum flexuosum]
MNIGKLNREIKIYKYIYSKNEVGEDIKQKTVIHTCRAKLDFVYGMELNKGDYTAEQSDYKFTIRYPYLDDKRLDNSFYIEYEQEEYNITYVKELGLKKWLELLVRKSN